MPDCLTPSAVDRAGDPFSRPKQADAIIVGDLHLLSRLNKACLNPGKSLQSGCAERPSHPRGCGNVCGDCPSVPVADRGGATSLQLRSALCRIFLSGALRRTAHKNLQRLMLRLQLALRGVYSNRPWQRCLSSLRTSACTGCLSHIASAGMNTEDPHLGTSALLVALSMVVSSLHCHAATHSTHLNTHAPSRPY